MAPKKAKKTNLKISKKEKLYYSNALLEDVNSKFDVLIEGHQILNNKIDDFKKEIKEKFQEVDYKFERVFDELHVIRNELKEKVSRDEFIVLEKRVTILEKRKS